MSPGDRVRIHMHDTPAGLRIDLDRPDHRPERLDDGVGRPTASGTSCTRRTRRRARRRRTRSTRSTRPAIPRGNTWSAHTYNVAMSDEIGHFENCLQLDDGLQLRGARQPGPGARRGRRQQLLRPRRGLDAGADQRLLQRRRGLRRAVVPQRLAGHRSRTSVRRPDAAPVAGAVHQPARRTGTTNFSTIAFETDLPRIEAADAQDNPPFCDRTTGANCVNPPTGAQFYPFFTTGSHSGTCAWQEGGNFIPGTTNHFGGSSTTEYGPLLKTVYPAAGLHHEPVLQQLQQRRPGNPCPVG